MQHSHGLLMAFHWNHEFSLHVTMDTRQREAEWGLPRSSVRSDRITFCSSYIILNTAQRSGTVTLVSKGVKATTFSSGFPCAVAVTLLCAVLWQKMHFRGRLHVKRQRKTNYLSETFKKNCVYFYIVVWIFGCKDRNSIEMKSNTISESFLHFTCT